MRLKKCKRCGLVFETAAQGQYLCDECHAAAKLESVYRERQCVDCGAVFWGFPASLRCDPCRETRQKEVDRNHRKAGTRRKLGSIDRCINCGAEYIVNSGRQKYCPDCADACITEAIRRRKREYMADDYMLRPGMQEQKAENRSYNKVCIVCGKLIDPDTATNVCSAECDAIRRRDQQRLADKLRAEKRSADGKAKRAALKAELQKTPGAYEAYRAEINAKARAAYANRKKGEK